MYCWNYCRKKQLWSCTAGITVERSSFGHVLLELLWKEAAMVIYCWNTVERSSYGHLLLELLWKEATVVIYRCNC